MSTCNGCGGVVGRDCHNPQECEWISRDQQARAMAREYAQPDDDRIGALEAEIAELRAAVAATLPAAPAPTEQAELKSIATNHDAMIILTQDYTREQKIMAVDAHMRRELAALAARQAPTQAPKEQPALSAALHAIHNLKEHRAGRSLYFPGEAIGILERFVAGAPDSRDAALEAAARIAMDGPLLTSAGESLYMDDNCKAMALMIAGRIRTLKGPAQ